MKVFVVVALIAFAATCQALSDEQKAAIGKYYTECVSTSKVDEALIKKLRAGEDVNGDNLKKYVGCMFNKLKFIQGGELQEDVIRAKIPSEFDKDEATKIIAECKKIKGTDSDDTAFKAYKCFLGKSSKLIEF